MIFYSQLYGAWSPFILCRVASGCMQLHAIRCRVPQV